MKKRVLILTFFCIIAVLLTSCKSMSVSINSVGKNNTTAKKIATEIDKNLIEEGNTSYILYGIDMSMDVEGIGKAKLYYTDKLPQNLQYSDITVITVDTRTGKVDSVSDADFASFGAAPYDCIVNGSPIMMSQWKKDSDEARKIAENTFYGEENFVYNYVQVFASVKNEIQQYQVTFISFVNQLQYVCYVDGMTGAVISKDIMEL